MSTDQLIEKQGVVTSIESWQLARTARNLAAHDYETDYDKVAEHFNTLLNWCQNRFALLPNS